MALLTYLRRDIFKRWNMRDITHDGATLWQNYKNRAPADESVGAHKHGEEGATLLACNWGRAL